MQKNIFLTGELRVGKSTVIKKTLEILKIPVIRGFQTRKIEGRNTRIILYPLSATPVTGHTVAQWNSREKMVFPEIFDEYGTEYLSEKADLILMDELGYLETNAKLFQEAVRKTLDGPIPVLGVIRFGKSTEFLDSLRERTDILLITVTKENRSTLPEKIAEIIREVVLSRK